MLEQHSYTDINAATWDQWAWDGIAWSIPVSHEVFQRAQAGQWDVILTASRPVPHSWFGELAGTRVLGLASGGGQQIPILCARGAVCTVLDYSQEQLARERLVAQREGYAVEIIRGDMTQPLPFEDESFDLDFHPVSNCYVEDPGSTHPTRAARPPPAMWRTCSTCGMSASGCCVPAGGCWPAWITA